MHPVRVATALAMMVALAGAPGAKASVTAVSLRSQVEKLARAELGRNVVAHAITPSAADLHDISLFRQATGLPLDGFAIGSPRILADGYPDVERYAFAVTNATTVVLAMQLDPSDVRGAWRAWYLRSGTLEVLATRTLTAGQVRKATPDVTTVGSTQARRTSPVCTQSFAIFASVASIALAFCPVSAGVGCAIAGGSLGVAGLYGAYECHKYADPTQYSVVELPPFHGYCYYGGCAIDLISTNPLEVIRVAGALTYRFYDATNGHYYGIDYSDPEHSVGAATNLGSVWRVTDFIESGTFYGNCGSDVVAMSYFLRFSNLSGAWYGPAAYALQPETVC